MLIAVLFSPLIGFLWVIALPNKDDELRHRQLLYALSGGPVDALNSERSARVTAETPRPRAEPTMPAPSLPQHKKGPGPFAIALIIILLLIAIIGGVSQLGSSANATFTTISGSM